MPEVRCCKKQGMESEAEMTVMLKDRKFTYTRIALAQPKDYGMSQNIEVTETVIAHQAFHVTRQEGALVHFLVFTPDGNSYPIKIVDRVIILDNGVPIE